MWKEDRFNKINWNNSQCKQVVKAFIDNCFDVYETGKEYQQFTKMLAEFGRIFPMDRSNISILIEGRSKSVKRGRSVSDGRYLFNTPSVTRPDGKCADCPETTMGALMGSGSNGLVPQSISASLPDDLQDEIVTEIVITDINDCETAEDIIKYFTKPNMVEFDVTDAMKAYASMLGTNIGRSTRQLTIAGKILETIKTPLK